MLTMAAYLQISKCDCKVAIVHTNAVSCSQELADAGYSGHSRFTGTADVKAADTIHKMVLRRHLIHQVVRVHVTGTNRRARRC
jgi:hypothetical protein